MLVNLTNFLTEVYVTAVFYVCKQRKHITLKSFAVWQNVQKIIYMEQIVTYLPMMSGAKSAVSGE